MIDDGNLANLLFRLWVTGEERVSLNVRSVYDFLELVRGELARPEDDLFSKL